MNINANKTTQIFQKHVIYSARMFAAGGLKNFVRRYSI